MTQSLKQMLGGPVNWMRRTANYTAKNGDGIQLDSTGGGFNITLPATPIDGNFVKFMDVGNYCSVNKVFILRNGSLIRNIAEDLEINLSGTGFTLVYNSVKGWQFETLEYVIPQADAIVSMGSMSGGYVTRSGNNLLYAPDVSNKVMCYNGRWIPYDIPDAGVTTPCTGLTPSTDYYAYAYWNNGIIAIELSTSVPTLQNGISVNGSKLCIARCRTDASGAIVTYNEDSSQHLICNYYNKRQITLVKNETTSSWNYTTATWRAANANNANRIQIVTDGKIQVTALVRCYGYNWASQGSNGSVGVGVDSITANSAQIKVGGLGDTYGTMLASEYHGLLSAGFHYLQWLEIAQAWGTSTWIGTDSSIFFPTSGIRATFMA